MGAQNTLVGICAAGAVASARTLFAAYLVFGLMATIALGSARPTAAGSDGELAVRIAQRAEPRIAIASAIAAAPASQVLFTIDVGPRDSLPITGFIRMRGLPQFVSVGDGQAIAVGVWAVPLYALPVIRLNIPAGISGRTEFEVALLSFDGQVLAEARTSLIVAPPSGLEEGNNPGLTPAEPSPR